MIRVLGADPGINGALSIISLMDGTVQLVDAIDVPTIGSAAKRRVDVIAVRGWALAHAPIAHSYVERVQAFPLQGRSSAFLFGRATGAIESVLACCEIPVTFIEPSQWKKFFKLPGKDKEAARAFAIQQFPSAHSLFARVKDHNRAESALLALFGAKLEGLDHAAA